MIPGTNGLRPARNVPNYQGYAFPFQTIQAIIDTKCCNSMNLQNPNSHLPVCWLHQLCCPRRHLAVLPSQVRPNLFGCD